MADPLHKDLVKVNKRSLELGSKQRTAGGLTDTTRTEEENPHRLGYYSARVLALAVDKGNYRRFIDYAEIMANILSIRTRAQTPTELEAQRTLERLVARYQLEPWCLTWEVLIFEAARPQSHPVLRLSARRLDGSVADELWLMACFIHEQIHWVTQGNRAATEAAIDELRLLFPEVPIGGRDGGRDAWSTYLHLIVCLLEYRAMVELVGEAQAQATLRSYSGYQWIYEQVFADKGTISGIAEKYGLHLPARNSPDG